MFKVAQPNNRWKYGFATLDDAKEFAGLYYRRTGHIVAIEEYKERVSKYAAR